MKHKVVLLTDYKGFFGSKQKSPIYRGGMDLNLIISNFNREGFEVEVLSFSEIDYDKIRNENPYVIYTSSEDVGGFYKSYIEDIVFNLENIGAKCIPSYKYQKAHNNKVYMELLRNQKEKEGLSSISSHVFGTLEELQKTSHNFSFPVVIKAASGAMSRGVDIAYNFNELLRKAKKISSSRDLLVDIKDMLRKYKYGDRYVKESLSRSKFIVQNFIPNLSNDWKVLVYWDKAFILYRGNRKNDFRASGSGKFIFTKEMPEGILDYAYSIMKDFDVPHISIDVGYDGAKFHALEFQFIYFGTTTLEKASFYFEKSIDGWRAIDGTLCLEEVYVDSLVKYINSK